MKKIKVLAAITAGLLISGVYNTEVKAEELEPSITYEGTSEAFDGSKLMDEDHMTSITFDSGDKVVVQAPTGESISGVYVIWDSPAMPWTMDTDNGTVSCGENGFLHEYIKLEQATGKVTINIPKDDIAIADIRIFSEGELPGDVQVWNPPCEQADFMLISSHSDDELLFFGGVIPVYSLIYDADIQVVYMTEFWSTEKEREHEKLNGLWTAGLDIYPVCGDFLDRYCADYEAACAKYDANAMKDYITKVVRQFKPQVVVTHDFAGEYGHGFHILVAECTAEVVANSMNADYYPDSAAEYGLWDTPKTYIHIYKENALKLDLSVVIEQTGKTALQMVVDGYDQHVSQHKWPSFFVSDDYEYSCADFGLYRTTVGYDTGNDMLENLKTYKIQAKEEQERLEQESREQASIEQESREKESMEQASREQASREKESREKASSEEASRKLVEQENAKTRNTIIIIVVAVVLVIGGALVLGVKNKKGKADIHKEK